MYGRDEDCRNGLLFRRARGTRTNIRDAGRNICRTYAYAFSVLTSNMKFFASRPSPLPANRFLRPRKNYALLLADLHTIAQTASNRRQERSMRALCSVHARLEI